MRSQSFDALKKELGAELDKYLNKIQGAALETDSQKGVDEIFLKHKARGKHTVLDNSGIEITGCDLAFDIGVVGVRNWTTAFWPTDRFGVSTLEPGSVPLGYVNGYQIYLLPQKGLPAMLVARYSIGTGYATWCPAIAGMPEKDTVFFVALERARVLGYLPLLQR